MTCKFLKFKFVTSNYTNWIKISVGSLSCFNLSTGNLYY